MLLKSIWQQTKAKWLREFGNFWSNEIIISISTRTTSNKRDESLKVWIKRRRTKYIGVGHSVSMSLLTHFLCRYPLSRGLKQSLSKKTQAPENPPWPVSTKMRKRKLIVYCVCARLPDPSSIRRPVKLITRFGGTHRARSEAIKGYKNESSTHEWLDIISQFKIRRISLWLTQQPSIIYLVRYIFAPSSIIPCPSQPSCPYDVNARPGMAADAGEDGMGRRRRSRRRTSPLLWRALLSAEYGL